MKKLLTILFLNLILSLPVFSEILKAGVEYTVDSARLVAFQDTKVRIPVKEFWQERHDTMYYSNVLRCIPAGLTHDTFSQPRRIVPFYENDELSFYGIQYDDTPEKKYYYSPKGYLLKYEVNTFDGNYPYKTVAYDIKGRLININLAVSEDEAFVFDRNKKLLIHWIGQNGFDNDGNLSLTRHL